jgi:hypothetical protein
MQQDPSSGIVPLLIPSNSAFSCVLDKQDECGSAWAADATVYITLQSNIDNNAPAAAKLILAWYR